MSVIQTIDVGTSPLIVDTELTSSAIYANRMTLTYTCSLTTKGSLQISRQPTFILDAIIKNTSGSRTVSVSASIPDASPTSGFLYDASGKRLRHTNFLSSLPSTAFPMTGALGDVYFDIPLIAGEFVAKPVLVVSP